MHCLLSNDSERIFLEAIDQHFAPTIDYLEVWSSKEMYKVSQHSSQAVHYPFLGLSPDDSCHYTMKKKSTQTKQLKISDMIHINHESISKLRKRVIAKIILKGNIIQRGTNVNKR